MSLRAHICTSKQQAGLNGSTRETLVDIVTHRYADLFVHNISSNISFIVHGSALACPFLCPSNTLIWYCIMTIKLNLEPLILV